MQVFCYKNKQYDAAMKYKNYNHPYLHPVLVH